MASKCAEFAKRVLLPMAVALSLLGLLYFVYRDDQQQDCLRFTRELKIIQACNAAKSCLFTPKDLKRMDALQTSCQGLAQ